MSADWLRFYSKKGSSKNVLLYIINTFDLENCNYIAMDNVKNLISILSCQHYVPSYIERYFTKNITGLTGLNIKENRCSFCGNYCCIFTRELRGVSDLKALCSSECKKFNRIYNSCSSDFFKSIPKIYRHNRLTVFLYAMSRRTVHLKRLTNQEENNNG